MEAEILIDGARHAFRLESRDGRAVAFRIGSTRYTAELQGTEGDKVHIRLNGVARTVVLEGAGEVFKAKGGEVTREVKVPFLAQAAAWLKDAAKPRAAGAVVPAGAGEGAVAAPMPGKILRVMVKQGDAVEKGTVLLTLEAMKMENRIQSPVGGVVETVGVTDGAEVQKGDLLVSVKAAPCVGKP